MIEARKEWRRWSGSPSDLIEACELAGDVLATWTDLPSVFKVVIVLPDLVTERTNTLDAIAAIHESELSSIKSITVDVEADRDAWSDRNRERRDAYYEALEKRASSGVRPEPPDDPPFPRADVSIRIWATGTTVEVQGEDRTNVEGLRNRLSAVLGRSANNAPGFDRSFTIAIGSLFASVFAVGFPAAVREFGLASQDGRFEPAEVVAIVCGVLFGLLIGLIAYWMYPRVELLPAGQPSRSTRFQRWFYGAVGALLLSLLASLLYSLV